MNKPTRSMLLALLLLAPAHASDDVTLREAGAALDRFHAAASRADEEAYFSLFAPGAVFLGTAAEERWTVEQFRAFVHPYFSAGRGWTYVPRPDARNVRLSPSGDVAWFDERLDNTKYGECRGTGVLQRIGDEWKIAQYNLTLPVPNEIALDVVEAIRALADEGTTKCGGDGFDDLDFWVGRWDVLVEGARVGTNRIEKILGGCAVLEHWRGAKGGRGKSLFYYTPATGQWAQVWVTERADEIGGVKHKRLVERLPGGGVRFQGSISLEDGSSYLDRTTLTPVEAGRVRQQIEVSRDGGETWQTTFDAIYVTP